MLYFSGLFSLFLICCLYASATIGAEKDEACPRGFSESAALAKFNVSTSDLRFENGQRKGTFTVELKSPNSILGMEFEGKLYLVKSKIDWGTLLPLKVTFAPIDGLKPTNSSNLFTVELFIPS